MPELSTVTIIKCDFNNPLHCQAEIDLMREYMLDKMGDAPPFNNEQNSQLIEGLRNHPTVLTLLAEVNGEFVGLTNSFINFGTFAAKPFLNIHDVIVKNTSRKQGVGRKLLEENIRIAKEELQCAKITLEVREDNTPAQKLYKSLGFDDIVPVMHFWAKKL